MEREFAATRDQVRRVDQMAMHQYAVPGVMLMENAGRQCAEEAARMLGDPRGRKVAVLAGGGNNGGDGFVIARHLANAGANVRVALLADAERVLARGNEASVNLNIILKTGIPVHEVGLKKEVASALDGDGLVVDAMLGTGTRGGVRPPFLSAIEAVNEARLPVLSVDVPSGLDCDTGRPLGVAVQAQRTVTFVFNKIGFTRPGARQYTGQVRVADIGVPRIVIDNLLRAWRSEGE